jgi:hypothetical protein
MRRDSRVQPQDAYQLADVYKTQEHHQETLDVQ